MAIPYQFPNLPPIPAPGGGAETPTPPGGAPGAPPAGGGWGGARDFMQQLMGRFAQQQPPASSAFTPPEGWSTMAPSQRWQWTQQNRPEGYDEFTPEQRYRYALQLRNQIWGGQARTPGNWVWPRTDPVQMAQRYAEMAARAQPYARPGEVAQQQAAIRMQQGLLQEQLRQAAEAQRNTTPTDPTMRLL